MIRSAVEIVGGVPTLTVNGEPIAANAYITYKEEKNAYADFAGAGYTLYSVPLYFSDHTINETSQLPPLWPGFFEGEMPDFTPADEKFRHVLAACPDALIFPRINLTVSHAWEKAHPEELCDTGFTENRRPCFSSDAWAEEIKRLLGLFLDHIMAADYADHVVGLQLACGNTEEWFPYDMKGSIGPRAREKYAARLAATGREDTEAEWFTYLSDTVADRIAEFAAFAKEKTGRRLIVGAFYGYTFEVVYRTGCHHAMGKLLDNPDIDFFSSPVSYLELRPVGKDYPCMLALDSVKHHGKLYFCENDCRTSHTCPPNDLPRYNEPVWQPRPLPWAIENMRTAFARALCHGHALWWFDMWGGWYADDTYMTMLSDMLKISKEAMALPRRSTAEVAVFGDESACTKVEGNDGRTRAVFCVYRRELGLMGAPYDIYLADDLDAVISRYKAAILLCPIMTPKMEAAIARLEAAGIPYKIITVTDTEAAPEEQTAALRTFLRESGVRVYTDRDAVVYACDSYLFVKPREAGVLALHLPEGMTLTPLYGTDSGVFPQELPAACSCLFRIG